MELAQADPVKAVTDMAGATEVVPFQAAAILVLLGALIYLWRLRESERREHFDHLKRLADLGTEKGDSRG